MSKSTRRPIDSSYEPGSPNADCTACPPAMMKGIHSGRISSGSSSSLARTRATIAAKSYDASDVSVFDMKGNRVADKTWRAQLKTDQHALVAHELRQPFGTIFLALGPLAAAGDADAQAAVRRIRASVHRLNCMVADLVDDAAIRTGSLTIFERISIASLPEIRTIASAARPSAVLIAAMVS